MAGVLFTPAPWRLLTDSALWSENWPGVPQPRRGEIRAKFTNCALCPAGCAARARCVGEQPVSLRRNWRRGLCPSGLVAHHLLRVSSGLPETGTGRGSCKAASQPKRGTEGIALLDLNPGRTVSWTYRRAMQSLNGVYLAESQTTAIDLHAAKTVLSIGVPLLDAWGTPANVLAARGKFRLILAEAMESGTAMLADEWMPLPAGTESNFAQGILDALKHGTLAGLPKELAEGGPSVVLGDLPEVSEINRLLGAYGTTIVARAEAPVADSWKKSAAPITQLSSVPDHSIQVLLIDESSAAAYIPWHRIERKLVHEDPLVVTFASSRGGYARHAAFALPAAMYPEVLDDIAPAADRVHAGFKLSRSALDAASFKRYAEPARVRRRTLRGVVASSALRERAGEIFKSREGTVVTYADGKEAPLKEFTEEAFWKALNEGGEWKGNRSTARIEPPAMPIPVPGESVSDLPLVAIAQRRTPAGSPLMTKLYQESTSVRPQSGGA